MPDLPAGTEYDGVVAMEAFASQPGIAGSDLALDRFRQAFTL
jgi:hydroxypyruvate isomerase